MYTYVLNFIDEEDNVLDTLNFVSESKTTKRYFRVMFETMPDYVNFAKFSLTVLQEDKVICIEKFDLGEDDFEIYQPTERSSDIDLVMCDLIGNRVACDFEVITMTEGVYKVDGSFEPLLLNGDSKFDAAKKVLNGANIEIVFINKYRIAYVDENGLPKNLKSNNTFPNLVGDVIVITNCDI